MTDQDNDKRGDLIGGFLKGLAVIESFDEDRPRQSIADISRATGFDRASCRRLLLTLVHAGYAEHDGKHFWLSPRTVRLGNAYLHSATLPNILQRSLEQLSGRIHESCSASILDCGEVLYIARASYQRVMSINLRIGSRLPIHCSSMGRVLLTMGSDEEAQEVLASIELTSFTPKTCTDPGLLLEEVRRVRDAGYAIVDEELEIGLRSIAVPVYDGRKKIVAAINIGTNAARVTLERLSDMYLNELYAVQAELRKLL